MGFPFLPLAHLLLVGCLPNPVDKVDTAESGSDADCTPGAVSFAQRIAMVQVCPGTFAMGSPSSEVGRVSNETQHTVTLTSGFYMGATEVTQSDFERFMGYNPSEFSGDPGKPTEYLTWHQAAAFANAVSAVDGRAPCYICKGTGSAVNCEPSGNQYLCEGYRLPAEAEWEYAARAGSNAAFSDGGNLASGTADGCSGSVILTSGNALKDLAWYCGNAQEPHPVGGLEANAWGLYDVHGNVWEWTGDWSEGTAFDSADATNPTGDSWGSMRVVRGASWYSGVWGVRVAFRGFFDPSIRYSNLGFRLCRSGP